MGRKAKILLGGVFSLFCIALLTGNLATCASASERYYGDRIIVQMRANTTESDMQSIAAALNGTVQRKLLSGNDYLIKLHGSPVDACIASKTALIKAYPSVKNLYRDGICRLAAMPTDPLFPVWISPLQPDIYQGQWQMQPDPSTGVAHIDAPTAWELEKGSNRVVVAVVDSGSFTSTVTSGSNTFVPHPDLANRLLPGYSAITGTADSSPSQIDEGADHGTHVAGIIAAQGSNGVGVSGVCWDNVWILPVRVCEDDGVIPYDVLADALIYCMNYSNTTAIGDTHNPLKVNVINMSLGGPLYDGYLEYVCHKVAQSGILLVAAAGNYYPDYEPPLYPAAYDDVVCVGASNYNDSICYFSERGKQVDIAAPGWNVWSTTWQVPAGTPTSVDGLYVPADPKFIDDAHGNGYRGMSGTSMATPHVSGAAALLLSSGVAVDDVMPILKATATPRGGSIPNDTYGYGELNIGAALKKASLDIQVTSPGSHGVVQVSKPQVRIDLRHCAINTVRVYLDDTLLIGPKADSPVMGYLSSESADQSDPRNLAVTYLKVISVTAGTKYLAFQIPTALQGLTHKIKATAGSSDLAGAASTLPAVSDTSYFTYEGKTLTAGWHLFSVPCKMTDGSDPGYWLGYQGMLARYIHYYDSTAGSVSAAYSIYSLENPGQLSSGYSGPRVRKDSEGTFTGTGESTFGSSGGALWPAVFSGNTLVHPTSSSTSGAPAGLGYWLYVPSTVAKGAADAVGASTSSEPYSIGAYHGWNMIGNPFPYKVPWQSVMVDLGGVRVSMADAVSNGWVSGVAYRWDADSGAYAQESMSSGYLMPWEAEWVRVTGSGTLSGSVDANGWPETDVQFVVSPVSQSSN